MRVLWVALESAEVLKSRGLLMLLEPALVP